MKELKELQKLNLEELKKLYVKQSKRKKQLNNIVFKMLDDDPDRRIDSIQRKIVKITISNLLIENLILEKTKFQ